MRSSLPILILAVLAAAMAIAMSCGNQKEESTVDLDFGDMYSEKCSIDYGKDLSCDESNPACRMVQLINHDRYQHPAESDCAPVLAWDATLAAIAQTHSKDMCDRGFFNHVNPDGKDPFDRLDENGVEWVAAGENIGQASGYSLDEALQVIEASFMDEPECQQNHRGIILGRNFTHVGVGVYECGDGYVYVTQDYAAFAYDDLREDPHEYCPNLDSN